MAASEKAARRQVSARREGRPGPNLRHVCIPWNDYVGYRNGAPVPRHNPILGFSCTTPSANFLLQLNSGVEDMIDEQDLDNHNLGEASDGSDVFTSFTNTDSGHYLIHDRDEFELLPWAELYNQLDESFGPAPHEDAASKSKTPTLHAEKGQETISTAASPPQGDVGRTQASQKEPNGYVCEHPQCDRSFKTRGLMRQHFRRKHQPKERRRIGCERCGKRFHYPKDLRRHQKVHDKAVPGVQAASSAALHRRNHYDDTTPLIMNDADAATHPAAPTDAAPAVGAITTAESATVAVDRVINTDASIAVADSTTADPAVTGECITIRLHPSQMAFACIFSALKRFVDDGASCIAIEGRFPDGQGSRTELVKREIHSGQPGDTH